MPYMKNQDIELYRVQTPPFVSPKGADYGLFRVPSPISNGKLMNVMCSPGGSDWQHVSVSMKTRCPNWPEMCFVKNLFWDENETVIQFHPPKSEYVNNHKYCLHLWKKHSGHELPPSSLVGIK